MNEIKNLKEQELAQAAPAAVSGARFVGIGFILAGILFLGVTAFGGWELLGGKVWLVFWLIPVAGALGGAYHQYVRNGRRVNGRVLTALLWAVFPFAIAAMWVLGVSWTAVWPISLVLVGLTIVLNQGR